MVTLYYKERSQKQASADYTGFAPYAAVLTDKMSRMRMQRSWRGALSRSPSLSPPSANVQNARLEETIFASSSPLLFSPCLCNSDFRDPNP